MWDCSKHDFMTGVAPATANPSLWRQGQLAAKHGLFEVTDGGVIGTGKLDGVEHIGERRPPRRAAEPGRPRRQPLPGRHAVAGSSRVLAGLRSEFGQRPAPRRWGRLSQRRSTCRMLGNARRGPGEPDPHPWAWPSGAISRSTPYRRVMVSFPLISHTSRAAPPRQWRNGLRPRDHPRRIRAGGGSPCGGPCTRRPPPREERACSPPGSAVGTDQVVRPLTRPAREPGGCLRGAAQSAVGEMLTVC